MYKKKKEKKIFPATKNSKNSKIRNIYIYFKMFLKFGERRLESEREMESREEDCHRRRCSPAQASHRTIKYQLGFVPNSFYI